MWDMSIHVKSDRLEIIPIVANNELLNVKTKHQNIYNDLNETVRNSWPTFEVYKYEQIEQREEWERNLIHRRFGKTKMAMGK